MAYWDVSHEACRIPIRRQKFIEDYFLNGWKQPIDCVSKYYPRIKSRLNKQKMISRIMNDEKSKTFIEYLRSKHGLSLDRLDQSLAEVVSDPDSEIKLKAIRLAYERLGGLAPTKVESKALNVSVTVDKPTALEEIKRIALSNKKVDKSEDAH